jgi:uncharacterized repeat protein (TIGR03803 family)
MTKLNAWKKAGGVFVLCTAAAVASGQNFTSLFSFAGDDGSVPSGGALAQGVDGTFYGTTLYGGTNVSCYGPTGCGTVFEITRDGVLTTLHRFCLAQATCTDGLNPSALILAMDGNFYGTTAGGGAYGEGTFFRITRQGSLTTLYSFCAVPNCNDGVEPDGVIQGIDGNFYGTTGFDGSCGNYGTVFKVTAEGKLTTLHSFCGSGDGSGPGRLVQATDGNFYGTTLLGGNIGCNLDYGGCGTVFKITTRGTLTTLHTFNNGNDGEFPSGGLIQATDGNLYGETSATYFTCGYPTCGTVFKISLRGTLTTLYQFCQQNGCGDGSNPQSTLVQGTDGILYGSTFNGGGAVECLGGCGTAFKMTLNGSLTTLHDFGSADGSYPLTMLQGTDGKFYGATDEGGNACPPYGCGTIYSLDMGLGPFVTFVQPAGRVGHVAEILGQGFEGTTGVSFNGVPANFKVRADTFIRATVPPGATTGYVTVTTPSGRLTSNVPFHAIP